MPNPPLPDWRDPKVFWHEDSQQWVMALAAKDKVMFYTSPNLKEWEYASEFGQDGGILANSLDRTSYAMSSQTGGESFSYEGDITLYEKNGREGAGGLVFRADRDAENGYVVSLDAKNGVITLSKNVNGTKEEIARKPLTIKTSSTYHVRVDVDGDHIQVFVNGQSAIEKTDNTFDYGYYGLFAWNSPAAFRNVKFQNSVYNEGAMPEEVDQVAKEPQKGDARQSGLLTDWSPVSGKWIPSTNGSNGGIWECPTLVELPIDGDRSKTKWVLLVSLNDGAPAGGSGMQYFVGSFDGKTFINDNPSDQILWVDYGADFYAAVDWSGIEGENGEKYWIGWMSNWQYANFTPTSTWRGSMTLPRKMELTQTEEGLRLKQTPVSLKSIRDASQKVSYANKVVSENSNLLSELSEDTFEIIAEFDVSDTGATEFGFEIRKGTKEYTTIGYDVANQQLFLDRTNSGFFDYGSNVVSKHEGPLYVSNGIVKMHIIVDRSAVEVFGNNGVTVITDQIFPDPSSKGLKIYSKGGEVTLKSLDIYPLKSIWKKKVP